MTHQNAQRVTVTIPPEVAEFLDKYQAGAGISRSEAMVRALRALQEQSLAEQYAELAQTVDPERTRFLEGNTDGLEAGNGSEWL